MGSGADRELSGRTALVTGAASGIGRAVAERLLAEGVDVVAADRDAAGLAKLDGVRAIACDLTASGERQALVEQARQVDFLVNAAGVIRLRRLDDVTEAAWDWVYA